MNGFNFNAQGNFNLPMSCIIEDNIIYSTSFNCKEAIGYTNNAYNELLEIANKYKDKLIELGVIEKEKTPEEIQNENQTMIKELLGVVENLAKEVKELKSNENSRNISNDIENNSEHKSKSAKSVNK